MRRFANGGVLALGAAVVLCGAVFVADPLAGQMLRNALFDQYQRWQPRPAAASMVRVVDIDDESLRRLGQWPWPRTRMAELTQRLHVANVKVLGFDMLFTEPDRTSPAAILPLWQPPPAIGEAIARLPDHDAAFAQEIGKGKVVLGLSLSRQASGMAMPGPGAASATASPARYVTLGAPALPFLHGFDGANLPLPTLGAAAAGVGALSFVPDADGIIRRIPLVFRWGEVLQPSLVAETARVALGVTNFTLQSGGPSGGGSASQGDSKSVGLQAVRIGKLVIPTNPQGEAWLHYSAAVPGRYIPAWRVLAGEFDPQLFKDQVVLVGASAQGLMDLRFSPLGHAVPGVEVHAQALEQVFAGQLLVRPVWAEAAELSVIVLGGLGLGWLALTSAAVMSMGVFLLLLAGLWGLAWWAFSSQGLLLDAAMPSLAVAVCFATASLVHHLATERRQRWIRAAFSRYVSPNLVSHLIQNPDSLGLGGQRQQCSFVFTDLAGFTSLMEQTDPAQAVAVLNGYLDGLIAIAFAHQGTLDRIVGDAVAIMFSAPVVQVDHQRRALACALEMQAFAQTYEAGLKKRGLALGQTRMGVHTGEVIVGNFGGKTIFDYRALGDPVNTASRLEGANKQLGTLVCVSEACLSGCPDAKARPIGRLLMQGKTQPIMAFEPVMGTEDLADYLQAYEWMRTQDSRALNAFEVLAVQYPADGLVRLHLQRLLDGTATQDGDLIALLQK